MLGAVSELVEDYFWNKTVSEFVADVALNSTDVDTLYAFLISMQDKGYAEMVGDKWIIQLPGADER